uniref:phosphoribosylformylglycinamidine cyclo-ligase n=1 Tax=Romanomermis culicivorax TaxID=13658 RepID=A0A915I4F9_ROMCU
MFFRVEPGDIIIGLPSSGLHSNGFSLVRKVIKDNNLLYSDPCPWFSESANIGIYLLIDISNLTFLFPCLFIVLGIDLLTPTKIYAKTLLPILRSRLVKAAAHITGGGLLENIPRVLPDHITANLDASKWSIPPVSFLNNFFDRYLYCFRKIVGPHWKRRILRLLLNQHSNLRLSFFYSKIFKWIASNGRVPSQEMIRTFNCGIGMVLIASAENAPKIMDLLVRANETFFEIGRIERTAPGEPNVCIKGLEAIFDNFQDSDVSTYARSGVNINEGTRLVTNIKNLCSSTKRAGCLDSIGGFGASFDLKTAGYEDPIVVSGTDGVGTKLKIAHQMRKHTTIGQDLVAMCVNDILVHNAEPLFFLDYYATGKLNVDIATEVIKGICDGCKIANCALIGGETAEMPGFYEKADYDLAGFAVGCVERSQPHLPNLENIKSGHAILGLASSGLHSNGFSLVRNILENIVHLSYTDQCPWSDEEITIGDELLKPTKIYVRSVLKILRSGLVDAAAHITGGGLFENLPRVLPKHLRAELDIAKWHVPK